MESNNDLVRKLVEHGDLVIDLDNRTVKRTAVSQNI
jgi:hypothetical protein